LLIIETIKAQTPPIRVNLLVKSDAKEKAIIAQDKRKKIDNTTMVSFLIFEFVCQINAHQDE
jgi:hypothetical protein